MFVKLRLQKNPEFAFIEVYDDTSFKLNARVVREVVELLQPYQFRYGHKQQFLGDFFELLLNTSIKQEAGQYFTPVPITRYIVSSLPIKEMIEKKLKANEAEMLPSVIDFACGTGHFLTEYMDKVQSIIENEIDISKAKPIARKKLQGWIDYDKFGWAEDYVYGIDADYRLVKSSKVSSFLNGDGEANIIRANGLDHFEKTKLMSDDLFMCMSSGSRKHVGKIAYIENDMPYHAGGFMGILRKNDNSPQNVMRYIYSIMSMQNTRDYFSKICTGSNIKNLNDLDLNIRLPMPPQEVRDSFVSEIEEVEKSISSVADKLAKAKADLQLFVDGIEQTYSSKTTKVKYVANLNPAKPDKSEFDKHMLVSFVDMPAVSEDGYIKKAVDRQFGTVISGGYTCFQNGDIIIAKITPCMENGKCALVSGMTNNYGFGSTEFHVIRADEQKILAKFLFTMLNREKIRLSAKANMTGASGHKRVPEQFYSNLDIIDIDIEKQKEIVLQVEKIKREITALENEIASAEERKQAILEKYLK